MKKGILIIGHGSRSTEAVLEFEELVKLIQNVRKEVTVRGAHLEISKPDIYTAFKEMVDETIENITLVPDLLFMGNHIKKDIPRIIEELKILYPTISIRLAKHIGVEPLMVEILLKRAENSVDC